MAFDLSNYEDVNARITRFRSEFPMGRIVTEIVHVDYDQGRVLVKATVYRTDDPAELPAATDYAYEFRSTHGVNRDFWIENCVTSAVGRAIGALTPSGARPTRQDMEKAQSLQAQAAYPDAHTSKRDVPTAAESIAQLKSKLGAEVMPEPPICKHGHRILKEGTGKTGSPYKGYVCPEKVKARQCPPIWMKKYGDKWMTPDDHSEVLLEAGRNLDPIGEREPVPDELLSESERGQR